MISSLPDKMRAVLLTGHGGFEQLEFREDVPVPVPAPGEVLIRVHAAAVNNTDINTRTGWYSRSEAESGSWAGNELQFPRIQGIDVCGEIVAVTHGIERDRIGERVVIEPCLTSGSRIPEGDTWYLGSECDGGFAEYVTVPNDHAFAISSDLESEELAAFPCAFSTAENMIDRSFIHRGETILVTGASGGVGTAAVQLAARRGARVIAVTGPSKAESVSGIGAHAVIDRDEVTEYFQGGRHLQKVIDVVGGVAVQDLLEVLDPGGTYAISGAAAGPFANVDLRTIYLNDLQLIGCTRMGEGVFENLVGYIERGEIEPVIAARFPIEDIVSAQEEFLRRRHVGKIVLTVRQD